MRLISKDANIKKILYQKGFDEKEILEFEKKANSIILRFDNIKNPSEFIQFLSNLGYFTISNENICFATTSLYNFEKTRCVLTEEGIECNFDADFTISQRYLLAKDKKLSLLKTNVMGIINVTPDSFYEGSRVQVEKVTQRALQMIQDGADVLDIGGESTRPFSEPVEEEEELKRVIPAIEAIRDMDKSIPISIDTYKSRVAQKAIEAGADIINDISGGTFDKDMFYVAAHYNVPIIIMHIKGTPKDMQKNPYYEDVIEEILQFFELRIEQALKAGVKLENIILDPGIGFGKRPEDNLEILRRCEEFRVLGRPILIGASRKSVIGHVLSNLPPEERLEGTLAISVICAQKKIEFVRVHDVKENKRAILMTQAIFDGV
ncbi:dihydropteroate synthase [Caldicellulosiruptor kronotskyensis 2002]|uniref:Dihydropteroate synthase n=1 Tax=Caldicellulosiruptor kronotskyensis (strain DSM 18902 / VKM B-2412 / 2002) TaxID=632348 RepID=E4SHG4_CALK2|nr:dihydropteroate synthase [Caldicellulosiruptor kronotskyensis]ADQ47189.1 dihydropteroate synthase [Caldicellulosiruptor kronotskyensis 2002]